MEKLVPFQMEFLPRRHLMGRYDSRKKGINSNEFYEEFRKERNVKKIEQYRTAKHPVLTAKVISYFHFGV